MQESSNNAVVLIKDVSKSYDEGKVQALKNINLSIPHASFVALAGTIRLGQDDSLNLIGALDVPDSGSIMLNEQHLEQLDEKARTAVRRERIGFIFQQFNLVPVLTARENVELPLEILPGYTAEQRKSESLKVLQLVGLGDMADRLPSKLSGGQQQRVAIARALVKNPPIVLADEPTANLDGETGKGIIDLMKKMRDELGTAFILSTHDQRVLDRAEGITNLVDGRIVS